MTVRTLIVDDSATMRALISALLRRDPAIEIVGVAASAEAARTLIRETDPDVITLDVEMPGMDGLSFLEKIMRLRPTPVVMVSGRTRAGAEATLRALELGAVGCYAKPRGRADDLLLADDGQLAAMVHEAAAAKGRLHGARTASPHAPRPGAFAWNGKLLAIAASTGGVETLGLLLDGFPALCPPTLIVQHMPESFTRLFAARLDARVAPRVVEAEDGQSIEPGTVYIAPGGHRHMIARAGSAPYIRLVPGDPVSGHRPSGDVLFRSVAQGWKAEAVGLILTGMGADGARGLLEMRRAGAATLGQSQASALIYGMPRAAHELGAVGEQLAVEAVPARVMQLCGR
ncbi:chemotaxis response regulator protein-glutamate methylesterase [Sphingomonas metalli]|uniref:Protein-glutamate methylesterase/protein-glutamine glutaminase n=1 Tax=Sphingomonas metalli TaxID=1779358 RepID=A0A916WYR5_9SPHN|nr:chemotaxis response regulator protein-glutamate methylesterase [Sphingomonas metalli]GGB40472.1 chemotaxis response regulator protein-glutamate methylesterase [Sphingomonas metalli]